MSDLRHRSEEHLEKVIASETRLIARKQRQQGRLQGEINNHLTRRNWARHYLDEKRKARERVEDPDRDELETLALASVGVFPGDRAWEKKPKSKKYPARLLEYEDDDFGQEL